MGHLLHLMFRCDGDVMESDVLWGILVDLNGALGLVWFRGSTTSDKQCQISTAEE